MFRPRLVLKLYDSGLELSPCKTFVLDSVHRLFTSYPQPPSLLPSSVMGWKANIADFQTPSHLDGTGM